MIRFRVEALINRSADEVFSFLTNVSRYHEWMPVENVRVVSGRADAVGGRLAMVMKALGRTDDMEFEVAEAQPGQRIVWRIVSGGLLRGHYEALLEPVAPGATRVVYAGALRLTGLWRLIEPLAAMEARKGEAAELLRAKSILEGSAAPAAANA